MKRFRLSVALVAAFIAMPAFAHKTPDVDSDYRVTGDPQAAPVQVFRLDGTLYLQLRDTHAVPAPIGVNGPIAYRIYGPYMLLPAVSEVTLHYGNSTAYVTSLDDGSSYNSAAMASQAQTTMSAPVDAANPASMPVNAPVYRSTYSAPSYTPHFRPVAAVPQSVAAAPPVSSDAVTGTISRPGAPAAASGFANVTSTSSPVGEVTGPSADYLALLAKAKAERRGLVLIVADGTVAGATTADKAMQACMSHGMACQVQYKGALKGQLKLETAQ
ncbi:hypothetical protein AB7849_15375 [Rhodanobacter sp. 115]|uniref:hypothetical protein n=1 Tax=Rhodanobacter sp. FW021-MT20 TaxID=1162282 RepID=UPI0034E3EA87